MRYKYAISICDDNDTNDCPSMSGSFPIKQDYIYEMVKNLINFASSEASTSATGAMDAMQRLSQLQITFRDADMSFCRAARDIVIKWIAAQRQ